MKVVCTDRYRLQFPKMQFSINVFGLVNRYLKTRYVSDNVTFEGSIDLLRLRDAKDIKTRWEIYLFHTGDLYRLDSGDRLHYISVPNVYQGVLRKVFNRLYSVSKGGRYGVKSI